MCAYIAHFAYKVVTETKRSHRSPTNKCDRASSVFPSEQLFIFFYWTMLKYSYLTLGILSL